MLFLRFLPAIFLACAASFSASAGSIEDFRAAIDNNDARTISSLVARGFDANMPYENGNRALHFAALENAQSVLQALVKAPNIDLNAKNAVDETPLMLAVIRGHQAAAEALLAAGAPVNKPGWSPLHYAASTGNMDLVTLLLGKQAAVDAKSPNGTTPLMMAARHGHSETAKLLLNAGADILARNEQGMTARDFATRHERKDVAQMLAGQEAKKR
jgi:ankyrin repeat protein